MRRGAMLDSAGAASAIAAQPCHATTRSCAVGLRLLLALVTSRCLAAQPSDPDDSRPSPTAAIMGYGKSQSAPRIVTLDASLHWQPPANRTHHLSTLISPHDHQRLELCTL